MGRVNTPPLTSSQRKELDASFKQGVSHCFRIRCQSILLKASGRKSVEVSVITGMCAISVNNWDSRYKSGGIAVLQTKSGSDRKPLLPQVEDKAAIKSNRQYMRTAKAQWESESGEKVSDITFKFFLKNLTDDINV